MSCATRELDNEKIGLRPIIGSIEYPLPIGFNFSFRFLLCARGPRCLALPLLVRHRENFFPAQCSSF